MKSDQPQQPLQPPQEMTDEELEVFLRQLDEMYLRNRYLRTPRPPVNSKLVITCIHIDYEASAKASQGSAKAETP